MTTCISNPTRGPVLDVGGLVPPPQIDHERKKTSIELQSTRDFERCSAAYIVVPQFDSQVGL